MTTNNNDDPRLNNFTLAVVFSSLSIAMIVLLILTVINAVGYFKSLF